MEPWRLWLIGVANRHGGLKGIERITGVPRRTLTRWKNGETRKPDIDALEMIARKLDEPMPWQTDGASSGSSDTQEKPGSTDSVAQLADIIAELLKADRSTQREAIFLLRQILHRERETRTS
jgi:transcriptional regulator with XRE-family HTH domain